MRLQSQISRVYNRKKYHKFWTVISCELVKKLGWKKGQKLVAKIRGDSIVISRKRQ